MLINNNQIDYLIGMLDRRIDVLEKVLKDSPEGMLRCRSNHGHTEYYLRCRTRKGHKTRYIKNGDVTFIRALADKYYAGKILPVLVKQKQSAETARLLEFPNELDSAKKIDPRILARCSSEFTVFDKFAKWKAGSIQNEAPFPEKRIFDTAGGEKVRSKSELIIANALFEADLIYVYEATLRLRGGDKRFPDFTILDPWTMEIFYWEHLGRMDDPEYACRAVEKIRQYAENGIVIGKNLICTFEANESPLRPKTVDAMIKVYFPYL